MALLSHVYYVHKLRQVAIFLTVLIVLSYNEQILSFLAIYFSIFTIEKRIDNACFNSEQSRRVFPARWSLARLCKFFYLSAAHAAAFPKVSGKTSSAFITSSEREMAYDFHELFSPCFVTSNNSSDLILRFADLRRAFANRWLNITKKLHILKKKYYVVSWVLTNVMVYITKKIIMLLSINNK